VQGLSDEQHRLRLGGERHRLRLGDEQIQPGFFAQKRFVEPVIGCVGAVPHLFEPVTGCAGAVPHPVKSG
jgi:hypothetical protein